MSEDELVSALKASESKKNFDKTRIEEIKKNHDLRHNISKSRRIFYEIENRKNLSAPKTQEIEKNLLELEKNLSKSKKYYDYDDYEYKGIQSIRNFPINKDYKPLIIDRAFSNNYVQYESIGSKNLSIKEYLDKIKPYLSYMINNYKAQGKKWKIYSGNTIIERKAQGEWKIQLTMVINFISSMPDSDETCTMRTKSDSRNVMMGSETDEIIGKLFKSLLQRCQEKLEESMRGSYFIFDSVGALYYDFNEITLSRGRSYIDCPEWLKNKKVTINPQNKDDRCFQYAATVALNYQKISNIKPFIDQYNWKEIYFPSHKEDCS